MEQTKRHFVPYSMLHERVFVGNRMKAPPLKAIFARCRERFADG